MGSVLAVGRSSFLAQNVAAAGVPDWRFVGHDAIARDDLFADVRCVVNFAWQPPLADRPADVARGPDLELARRIGARPIHYVMLSSRLVYGHGAGLAVGEERACRPTNAYGAAKLAVENGLRDLLGDRLTVLRVANIIGYDRAPGRATFIAQALRDLKQTGRIRLDVSPFVGRDFLPVDILARTLARVAAARRPGTFNIGSGLATPTGRIAEWLATGHGGGQMIVADFRHHDEFSLDIGRAAAAFGLACQAEQVRECCLDLGRRLAAEGA